MMNNRVYLFLLILGTAFWGVSFPLVKEGLSFIDPHVFLIYRFVLAALVLSIVFYKYWSSINLKTLKYGIAASIPLVTAISLQTVCLKYISSSNAAFIAGMDVLLVPIFKLVLFKKSVQTKVWVACILALIGLYIIAMSSSESGGIGYGDVLAVFGAFAFAIYIIMIGKWGSSRNVKIQSLILVQMFSCVVLCLAVSLFYVSPAQLIIPNNYEAWRAVLFTGILATAYMYSIQNIAQKYIEDEKIALTYLCEPIFATIAGYYLIGEAITVYTIIGGLLILFSLFICEYRFRYIHLHINLRHKSRGF